MVWDSRSFSAWNRQLITTEIEKGNDSLPLCDVDRNVEYLQGGLTRSSSGVGGANLWDLFLSTEEANLVASGL